MYPPEALDFDPEETDDHFFFHYNKSINCEDLDKDELIRLLEFCVYRHIKVQFWKINGTLNS